MRIAVGQLCSLLNPLANARVVNKLIDQAVKAKAQVLFLPEASDYLGRNAAHLIALAQHLARFVEDVRHHLRQANSDMRVSIGVHEPGATTDARIKNVHLWIEPDGTVAHSYQKIHLYDVNVPNGPILMESKAVEPGTKLVKPFAVGQSPFSVGLAVCYDIRFPEVALALRQHGANIVTFPSAFTTVTGAAHWQLLGKARALDSQLYVVMAAQCGVHDVDAGVGGDDSAAALGVPETPLPPKKKRQSYGNSLIVGPWGEVVAEGKCYDEDLSQDIDGDGDYYQLIVADLDPNHVATVRTNMPLLDHRRKFTVE